MLMSRDGPALAPGTRSYSRSWIRDGAMISEGLLRMGVTPLALGVADPAVLGAQAGRWGSYYEHRPLVLAGRLDVALQVLARRGVKA